MRIPETATGEFEPGDPVTGKPGSRLSSAYMNSQLRESLNILRAAGIAQSNDDDAQLLAAIRKLINTATAVVVPPVLGGTGLDYVPPGNYLVGNGTATMTSRTPAQVFSDLGIAQYVADQRRVVVLNMESSVNANTLTAPETLYKWGNFGGTWTNFPNVHSAGYLQTRELNQFITCQELTLVEGGSKALCYFRLLTPAGWQPWRVASAFSKASQLPTWDAGDVYIDGLGWHRWNGAAYAVNDALRQCYFDELPTTDVGPIYVMDFGEIWSWADTTGVADSIPFRGYRSPNCGQIAFFMAGYPPEGWLRANGSVALKTRYAGLYSVFGGRFGETATHFTLLDLRGEFLRGLDDARGVDPGRGLGTWQADAFQGHWHQMYINAMAYGTANHEGSGDAASWSASSPISGRIRDAISDGVNGTPRTARETRPRNVAGLACIKI